MCPDFREVNMTHSPIPVVRNIQSVEPSAVPRCRGTTIQVMLGAESGAPSFDTRHFKIEPGGRIPRHRHASIEHEQVVLEGRMTLGLDDQVVEVGAGDFILIPAGTPHWYENRGSETVRFVCVIPRVAEYQTEWLEESAE
jgi:quercetin dioxygenase-like cupin family protein